MSEGRSHLALVTVKTAVDDAQPADLVTFLEAFRLRADLDDGSARLMALTGLAEHQDCGRRTHHREGVAIAEL